ncbi:hypothetical protein PATSB16_32870 [Pandoraea thiooxydans]|nr:hypothetical protein PATSB16_32870 [Pandoraea thiooxydans]
MSNGRNNATGSSGRRRAAFAAADSAHRVFGHARFCIL